VTPIDLYDMTLIESSRALASESRSPGRFRAVFDGVVIAEGDATVVVEGNHYFRPADVKHEYLRPSATHTTCHWKGLASYYDIVVGDQVNRDAAWYYPEPSRLAERVRGMVAFWKGVRVEPADLAA
jgi:uncharacterized protein (DUF427 family)